MDFYQIMTLIAVVAFVVLVIYAARALMQIQKTAESVEYLAITTAAKVDKTNSTFQLIDNVSSILDNGLFKAIKLGMDLVNRHKKK